MIVPYPPHYHGIFSSFLIDGLLGRASENGLITFNALRDFVEKRMQDSNQRLKFNGQGDSKILNLQLAIEPKKHKEYVQQKIQEAKKFNKKDVDSILDTSKLVNELLGYELCQDEANILKNSITNVLEDYNNKILEWIAKNRSCFRSRIDDIDSTLYTTINSLDRYLSSFDMFIGIKPFELCLLYTLCDIINNSEKIDDSADNFEIQQVNSFIQRCQTCFNVFGKESKKESSFWWLQIDHN